MPRVNTRPSMHTTPIIIRDLLECRKNWSPNTVRLIRDLRSTNYYNVCLEFSVAGAAQLVLYPQGIHSMLYHYPQYRLDIADFGGGVFNCPSFDWSRTYNLPSGDLNPSNGRLRFLCGVLRKPSRIMLNAAHIRSVFDSFLSGLKNPCLLRFESMPSITNGDTLFSFVRLVLHTQGEQPLELTSSPLIYKNGVPFPSSSVREHHPWPALPPRVTLDDTIFKYLPSEEIPFEYKPRNSPPEPASVPRETEFGYPPTVRTTQRSDVPWIDGDWDNHGE